MNAIEIAQQRPASAPLPSVRDRAAQVAAIARRDAEQTEAQGGVTQAVFDATREAGLYSLTIPKVGDGCDFRTFAETVETMSHADGSAGWIYMVLVAMQTGVWMHGSPAMRDIVFNGDGSELVAGQIGRFSDAVKVPGGYRVTGRHGFASGSRYAKWICAGGTVSENGEVLLNEDGTPRIIHYWVPKHEVDFIGNWDVTGLAATESFDYELKDCFVPEERAIDARAIIYNWPVPEERRAPFLNIGGMNIAMSGHGAIALGITGRALEEVARISCKMGRPDYPTVVRDHPAFQHEFGLHDVKYRSARANYYEAFAAAETSVADGSPLSPTHQARLRQATAWVHMVADETVSFARRWSGSEPIRRNSALGRCARDIGVATQHLMADPISLATTAPDIIQSWLPSAAG